MFKIVYSSEAKDKIQRLSSNIQLQIKTAIERIAQEPALGKRLTQELSGYHSYRSGDYRIIYKVYHHEITIVIVTVGHRKDVYSKTARKWG